MKKIMLLTIAAIMVFALSACKSEEKASVKDNPEVLTETAPTVETEKEDDDIYSFKTFDINAKCSFVKTCATELFYQLLTRKKQLFYHFLLENKENLFCTLCLFHHTHIDRELFANLSSIFFALFL